MIEKIKLINHSSLYMRFCDDLKILTDPWYSGLAFDGGWSFNPIVMQEEQLQIYALLFFVTTFFIFKFIEKFYNAKK